MDSPATYFCIFIYIHLQGSLDYRREKIGSCTFLYAKDLIRTLMNKSYLKQGLTKMDTSQATKEGSGGHILDIRVVKTSLLRGHERIDPKRLYNLKTEIESDGILKRPIAVDINTKVILDGHHRIEALKLLGCSKIPVLFVDYQSPKIGVRTAENGEEYSKEKVIEAALKGKPLPPKSTWHYVTFSERVAHISKIQKRVDVSLEDLK